MDRTSEEDPARMSKDHDENNELSIFAMKAAGIGAWQLDVGAMTVKWDECCRELFGFSDGQDLPADNAFKHVHPEDVTILKSAIDSALSGSEEGKLDIRCRVMRHDKMHLHWISFSGRAYFDNEGKPLRIGGIAKDITRRTEAALRSDVALQDSEARLRASFSEAVLARQRLEGIEHILKDAMELAKLATWTIHIKEGLVEYSERMRNWLGIPETERKILTGMKSLPHNEQDRVKAAMDWALNPKSDGLFDLEYSIVNQETGRERVIHSQGRTLFDELGHPVTMMGTALDVTQQRNVRLALEHEVYQRTEELDAANEELTSINEELHSVNDEQIRLNASLEQSNENLQQFAHVASHDLKEPMRKIKIFLSMIEGDSESSLSSKSVQLMHRVHVATDRMFSMINGVLNYSTLNSTGHQAQQVDLNKVLNHVHQELEVLAEQKNASIHYSGLPTIEGAGILLNQLFYNLLINSLKFSRENVQPVINVSSSVAGELVTIVVADNGIGFEQAQSEKIFNMFARLHSKDKHEGTGLGLALCKKIAERHKGSITADGRPNEGATFIIVLPLHQPRHTI